MTPELHQPTESFAQSIEDAICKATETVGKGKRMRYRYSLAMDQMGSL